MTLLAVFLGMLFAYGLLSGRLERTILTAPMLFTAAGAVTALLVPALGRRERDPEMLLKAAEIGLVLLLFSDACRTDLGVLRSARSLPSRLLGPGMLLTLLLGAVIAKLVFPGLSVWEAGILSAILAPTDAGLGQVIVTDPKVPPRVRQALNVEAGLNDGLSVPFLLFFIALAATHAAGPGPRLWRLVVEQLGYGAGLGLGVGLAGGALLGLARRRGWTSAALEPIAVLALPLLCLPLSEAVGASMFIAAFVAGLSVQVRFREASDHGLALTEECGQVLNLSVFFLFGVVVARDGAQVRVEHALYAAASLTIVRMLPVGIALLGTGLSRSTVAFIGWFGPRGLASIVLCLVYVSHRESLPDQGTIRLAVLATVLASIVAHGLSARTGIRRYAARVARLGPGAPELAGAGEEAAGGSPGGTSHGGA